MTIYEVLQKYEHLSPSVELVNGRLRTRIVLPDGGERVMQIRIEESGAPESESSMAARINEAIAFALSMA